MGELGLDRPARMVMYYLLDRAQGNNFDIDFSWTLDTLGPLTRSKWVDDAGRGISEWIDALHAGGIDAGQTYLDKYKNPDVAEPSVRARLELGPGLAEAVASAAQEGNVRV